MRTTATAAYLNNLWGVGASHALYIHDGHWYHRLKRFPGALFDRHGYLLFPTEQAFLTSPHLSIGKQVSVRPPGISAVPGYVRIVEADAASSPFAPPAIDIDIHLSNGVAIEGRLRLVAHLERERNQSIVRKKKKHSHSLECEVCGFSFAQVYGEHAGEYCEVHHLAPLSDAESCAKTSLADLAILCANCHRVVHLRLPPHTLEEVRAMLARKRPDA